MRIHEEKKREGKFWEATSASTKKVGQLTLGCPALGEREIPLALSSLYPTVDRHGCRRSVATVVPRGADSAVDSDRTLCRIVATLRKAPTGPRGGGHGLEGGPVGGLRKGAQACGPRWGQIA